MMDVPWRLVAFLAALLAVFAAIVLYYRLRRLRRARLLREPFPHQWRALLEASVPLYRRMPQALRRRLEPVVRAFLADVEFVGCGGLEMTDEMRLAIAAQACVLVMEHGTNAYAGLHSVLVYPDQFVVEESDVDEAGVVTEGTRVLSGQTFETARIILSWRDVVNSSDGGDAYNVVLHEFAHYLDHSVGGLLTERASHRKDLRDLHELLEREYDALCDAVDRGEDTLIDPYGAEHLAEFFAVATETFFEQPREMRLRHRHLYEELQRFYRLDPAGW